MLSWRVFMPNFYLVDSTTFWQKKSEWDQPIAKTTKRGETADKPSGI